MKRGDYEAIMKRGAESRGGARTAEEEVGASRHWP